VCIRTARGFSLIEALLTVLVLSIGLLGLAQLQARIWVTSGLLHTQNSAYQLGLDRLEQAVSAQLIAPDLVPEPPLQVPRGGALYATRLSLSAGGQLQKAQVDIAWTAPTGRQAITLGTAVERTARASDTRLLLPAD
jgi:Tfp pilus assembly protein PilV